MEGSDEKRKLPSFTRAIVHWQTFLCVLCCVVLVVVPFGTAVSLMGADESPPQQ